MARKSSGKSSTSKFDGDEFEVAESAAPAEPEKPARKVGMIAGTWKGVKVWRCPDCRATTFKELTARNHACAEVRKASSE